MRNGLLALWGEVPERGGCLIVVPPAPDEAVGGKQRNKQRVQTTPRLDILKGKQRMAKRPRSAVQVSFVRVQNGDTAQKDSKVRIHPKDLGFC